MSTTENKKKDDEHDNNEDELNVYQKEAAEYEKAAAEVFGEEGESTKSTPKEKDVTTEDEHKNDTGEDQASKENSLFTNSDDKNNNNDSGEEKHLSGSGDGASDRDRGVDNTNNNDGSGDNDANSDDSAATIAALKSEIESLKQKLEKTEQKMRSWNGRIRKANERAKHFQNKLEEIKNENESLKNKLADGGDSSSDSGEESDKEVLDRFKSEFPELVDVINVLQRRVEKAEKKVISSTAKSSDKTATKSPNIADDDDVEFDFDSADNDDFNDGGSNSSSDGEPTEHYKTIVAAHPDIDEIVNSGVLATWIRKQADFIRPHLEHIYQSGTAKQVIGMVKQFKDSTGWKSQLERDNNKNNNKSQDDISNDKKKKLDAMRQVKSDGTGPPREEKSKDDYYGTAKEIGLV